MAFNRRTGLALALLSLAPAAFAGGGFDGRGDEPALEFPRHEKKPELWITLAGADGKVNVFPATESLLPELSEAMHERFNRCGGFFVHETAEEAEAALAKPPVAPTFTYTLDQQDWTSPVVKRVQEAPLRATIEALAAHHNRYYASDTGVAAARWIQERWQKLAERIPGANAQLYAHAAWKQPSVVLTIPGTEFPDEIVILGGHMDSIAGWNSGGARAPGADDNASGIAVLTEGLRVLADAGFRPKRTVQFMAYAAEEVGLRGSQEIAKAYAQGGKKVLGVVQFDMTNFKGSADEVFLLTDNVSPALTDFLGRLLDTYVGAKRAATKCGYACSDHASWTKNGFPASAAFEAAMDDMNHNIHSDKDTLANSGGNAAHSVNFAKLAAAFAAELAKTTPAPASTGR